MSGIVGIWNLDGEPVSRETLSAMSARLAHRGPDGENILIKGAAGFAFQNLQVTPESLHEHQPLEHSSGTILLWDGRLDNREELLSGLADSKLASDCPDPSIVLAAYTSRGEDFLKRLDGDFALALFDPRSRKLLLARDAMGARTLYHCKFGNHFLVASEIKALMAHPAVVTKPDDRTVAEWMYQIPDYSDPTRTFYQHIYSVSAGMMVRVTPERVESRRFWEFDTQKQLRLRGYPEYVEAYEEAYKRAVSKRLRSAFPIAIALSGGLDSSSNYCMAQEISRSHPGSVKEMIPIGVVPEDPLANEESYQAAVMEKYGAELLKVPLADADSVGSTQEGAIWYGEGPLLKWLVWRSVLSKVRDNGARVFVSGYFGDHILTNPHYLLDIAARGNLLSAYRHGKKYFTWWDGFSGEASTSALYRTLKGYLVPERFRPFYHRVRRPFRKNAVPNLPWYTERLAMTARKLEREGRLLEIPRSRAHVKIIYHYLYSRLFNLRWEMDIKTDAEFPTQLVFPFRDRSLVALLMSMPGEIVYQSGSRGVHRDAMKGILPETVRLRRTKAMFSDPVKRGAVKDLDRMRPSLEKGAALRWGYLSDTPEAKKSLDLLRARLEAHPDATLSWYTNELVALELWLARFFAGETPGEKI